MQQKLIQDSINDALGKIANLTKELGLDQEFYRDPGYGLFLVPH